MTVTHSRRENDRKWLLVPRGGLPKIRAGDILDENLRYYWRIWVSIRRRA
jgi:hypothetical protein